MIVYQKKGRYLLTHSDNNNNEENLTSMRRTFDDNFKITLAEVTHPGTPSPSFPLGL